MHLPARENMCTLHGFLPPPQHLHAHDRWVPSVHSLCLKQDPAEHLRWQSKKRVAHTGTSRGALLLAVCGTIVSLGTIQCTKACLCKASCAQQIMNRAVVCFTKLHNQTLCFTFTASMSKFLDMKQLGATNYKSSSLWNNMILNWNAIMQQFQCKFWPLWDMTE